MKSGEGSTEQAQRGKRRGCAGFDQDTLHTHMKLSVNKQMSNLHLKRQGDIITKKKPVS